MGKLVRVLEGDVLDALAAAPLKNKPQLAQELAHKDPRHERTRA